MASYAANLLPSGHAPVHNIYCIGRNYGEHAAELKNPLPEEPVVFLKAVSSLRRPEEAGVLAFPDETFHHEAEVVLLIGKEVKVETDCTWQAVSHIGLGLDLTRREVQTALKEKGLPWARAKSFRGAAVLSPMIARERFANLSSIQFEFSVNGAIRQTGDTSMMLFPVERILRELCVLHPLSPGDLIYTGTPKGVGPLRGGDHFELKFTGTEFRFTGQL